MNLAEILHSRWAADGTLKGLLDDGKVFTGQNVDPTPPYAVITRPMDTPVCRMNDGTSVNHITARFQLFHANHDTGRSIVYRIKEVYNRTTFDLSGLDKVINMQIVSSSETQHDDGLWEFVVDFRCQVFLQNGI